MSIKDLYNDKIKKLSLSNVAAYKTCLEEVEDVLEDILGRKRDSSFIIYLFREFEGKFTLLFDLFTPLFGQLEEPPSSISDFINKIENTDLLKLEPIRSQTNEYVLIINLLKAFTSEFKHIEEDFPYIIISEILTHDKILIGRELKKFFGLKRDFLLEQAHTYIAENAIQAEKIEIYIRTGLLNNRFPFFVGDLIIFQKAPTSGFLKLLKEYRLQIRGIQQYLKVHNNCKYALRKKMDYLKITKIGSNLHFDPPYRDLNEQLNEIVSVSMRNLTLPEIMNALDSPFFTSPQSTSFYNLFEAQLEIIPNIDEMIESSFNCRLKDFNIVWKSLIDILTEIDHSVITITVDDLSKHIIGDLKEVVLKKILFHLGFPLTKKLFITSFGYVFFQLQGLINYYAHPRVNPYAGEFSGKIFEKRVKNLLSKSNFTIIERNYEIPEKFMPNKVSQRLFGKEKRGTDLDLIVEKNEVTFCISCKWRYNLYSGKSLKNLQKFSEETFFATKWYARKTQKSRCVPVLVTNIPYEMNEFVFYYPLNTLSFELTNLSNLVTSRKQELDVITPKYISS